MALPPDLRGFGFEGHGIMETTHDVSLYDSDTRRTILVTLPNPRGLTPPDDDPEFWLPTEKAADALTIHLEHVPPDTVAIEVDEMGKLLSFCTDPARDLSSSTDNLDIEEYQLPPLVADRTIRRSELIEVRRLAPNADLVSYAPSLSRPPSNEDRNRYVFKYSTASVVASWGEIQMLARLPPHPNIVLLDRVVLDEMTGSQVVGFTTRYIAGGTLKESRRPFKLKWLRQLMQTVDDLNFKHGIIHQDIADRNLMVDPDTDMILLFDFNFAYRVGVSKGGSKMHERKRGERDDVKGVLVFLYEFITRDPILERYALDLLDEKDYKDPGKWVKHPDVELDDDVAEFYFELMTWVRQRRAGKQMAHHTEAPEHLDWPDIPEKTETMGYMACERRVAGLPFLEWQRPSLATLDPTRRILATGRYADEEEAAQKAKAAAAAKAPSPSATAIKAAAAGKGASSKERDERLGTTKNIDETVSDGVRRKLRPRQTKPTKRKQGDGDAGAAVAVDGPAKRRTSRQSSPALSRG
ncbi:hypothetical protein C8A00DRAFT_36975 [Chaetomidium leptoderma]|uniref:Protein kinase domain-containing protein n=1 Tax=Chaetomidium leptoderma TaxID=669021 RepID=A0AAN6VG31_9PEZI|nr:hypothetical protein C8A00DRAFT_36975 [Chaetomidium leptoderma]